MGKSKKSNDDTKNNDNDKNLDSILSEMPMAKAVIDKDITSLEKIIETALRNNNSKSKKNLHVQNLKLEKSVGEAFTGGRSTPVYYVQAQVVINNNKTDNNNNNDSSNKNNNEGTDKKKNTTKDRFFVIKLVVMLGSDKNNNNSKDDKQILQKRESYAVERRFYDHVAPTLKQHSVPIPKLLASDHAGIHPLPVACWLMTDIRVQFPLHPTILNPNGPHIFFALDWVAKLHALYWKDPVGEWRRCLWQRGGFWTKSNQNDIDSSANNIATTWLQTCQWMTTKGYAVSSSIKTIGTRLQALYPPLIEFMTRQSKSTVSTLIHGDFKAANLFFYEDRQVAQNDHIGNDVEEESITGAAAAVDFQYSGAGCPAEDIAYILFPDALVDYWEKEERLLKYYHDRLMDALILANKGGPSSLPFETFVALYQLSRVELLIYWIQKGWVGSTAGDAKLVMAVEQTITILDGGGENKLSNDKYKQALEAFVGQS